jgi:hypothetical protein
VSAPYGPDPAGYQPVAYPMSPVATPLPMPCPRSVRVAFWLTLAGAVLFGCLVSFVQDANRY